MSNLRERIIEYLRRCPDGVDDDDLAYALKLKYRQQANSYCRRLAAEGVVRREMINGKIHNILLDTKGISISSQPHSAVEQSRPWHWEGNVQQAVVTYLETQGYTVLQASNTANHQHGKDIVARGSSGPLWVTVKGYPRRTERTQPTTQAGHWFKDALFDIIAYRQESQSAELMMALPDFPRYRRLTKKIAWLQAAAHFSYVWVSENGEISVE